MREDILQYYWQFGNFSSKSVYTTKNEKIEVLSKGYLNTDQGPDFLHAKVQIGSIEWAGSVEIHVRSSDWKKHNHGSDAAYENVILHVVYENDVPIFDSNNMQIPTLELKQIIDNQLLEKCKVLFESKTSLACQSEFASIAPIIKLSMFDKVLHQRLERKANEILLVFEKYNRDWEQTSYHFLLRNFGFKTNAEPFARLAELLPFKIIQKLSENRIQIEAALFGVAGFLDSDSVDDYQAELKKEYAYLVSKYDLKANLNSLEWKFFRLRPSSFPTVRISQLAAILQKKQGLHAVFFESKSKADLTFFFEIKPSPYWQQHHQFGESSNLKISFTGTQSIENVLINTICQIKTAYGIWKDNSDLISEAIQMLETLKPENNKITRIFEPLGITPKNAYDSQALIELYNEFCAKKKCLSCTIGHTILQK